MAVSNGDIVLERMYLGEYLGKEITEDTFGIVMSIKDNQALVYWFNHKKTIWNIKRHEHEYFDLNNIKDKAILEDMIDEYNRYKQANRAG